MPYNERKKELLGKAVELQLNKKKEEAYIRILFVFGILSICIATIMTIMQDMRITGQGTTMYVMGIFLFVASIIWREKSTKRLTEINNKLSELDEEEGASYRFGRTN